MEDVGNDIFQILVSNSLFRDVKVDSQGYVIGCSMHDLVHDVLLSLSEHESLCLVDAKIDDVACIPKVKHLALYQKRKENFEYKVKVSFVVENNMTARALHTLFFLGKIEKKFAFQPLKCMRILKLNGCTILKINDSIGELVHLRYLDLSDTSIRDLPESIGKLYHLQTLNLDGCYHLKKFPISIRNLISLRYCKSWESIPANIIGQLTSLRTLESFKVGREKGSQIEELGHLKHLGGKLSILQLKNVSSTEDAVKADLSGKKNLNEITYDWSGYEGGANRKGKDVFEGLQPPSGLKTLSIYKFSCDNFPEWVMKMAINIERKWMPLDKLMKITLLGCYDIHSLPRLEHLPHLRELKLENMGNLTCLRSFARERKHITRSTPLSPSLRFLQLKNITKLEKWIDGETNSSKMISPVLQELYIEQCPKIILLDECHPHPLVSLYIGHCPNLVSIKNIQGLTSLKDLSIISCRSFSGITNLPNQCHSLKNLQITGFNKLTSLPREISYCFFFLNELKLGPFLEELDSFPSLQGIENLRNHLRSLELNGVNHWESMPEEIQHLTSLTELTIKGFGIRELPVWLTNMSSIRHISFYECKGLNESTVELGAPWDANLVILNGEVYYR